MLKILLMLGAMIVATLISLKGGLHGRKAIWWYPMLTAIGVITFIGALALPIAGTLTDVVITLRANSETVVPLYCEVSDISKWTTSVDGATTIPLWDPVVAKEIVIVTDTPDDYLSAAGKHAVVRIRKGGDSGTYQGFGLEAVNPALTLPYIVGLEERSRILFFHVPMAWIATIAFLCTMFFGVKYLRTRNLEHDTSSAAFASAGLLFAVLATLTGAVWAKFNWGAFWNWDPRQTSIAVLILVYLSYLQLRKSIPDARRRATLSAVYSIPAFITVPFLMFVLPRILPGLHPGSADDVTSGPLLDTRSDVLNFTKQIVFALSLFTFFTLFFTMINLRLRAAKLERIND